MNTSARPTATDQRAQVDPELLDSIDQLLLDGAALIMENIPAKKWEPQRRSPAMRERRNSELTARGAAWGTGPVMTAQSFMTMTTVAAVDHLQSVRRLSTEAG